jgi:hypothetical protein
MNEALTFFVDVLGCKKAMSFGPIADPEPNGAFMKDALGVDPKTVITQITLVRCGRGLEHRAISYQSPDQKVVPRTATSAAITSRFTWMTSKPPQTTSEPRTSRP